MAEDEPPNGAEAWVTGYSLLFVGYLLVLVYQLAGPVGRLIQGVDQAGPYAGEARMAILILLGIAAIIAVFIGLFLAFFQLISLHQIDIDLRSTVEVPEQGEDVLPERLADAQQTVPIEPELVFPESIASLLIVLPPLLLLYWGYLAGNRHDDQKQALIETIAGYGVAAAITIFPVIWIFNNFVGPFFAGLAPGTGFVDPTIEVVVDDYVETYLIIGLIYPAVFGTAGVFLSEMMDSSETGETRTRTTTSPSESTSHEATQPSVGTDQGAEPVEPVDDTTDKQDPDEDSAAPEQAKDDEETADEPTAERKTIYCPSCGSELSASMNYCTDCGYDLSTILDE